MADLVTDTAAMEKNWRHLRREAGKCEILAVVKANAYGLGLIPVARLLASWGAGWLVVSEPEEAFALRRAGIGTEILLLRPVYAPGMLERLIGADVTLSLTSAEGAEALRGASARCGKTARVHLAINTGLGRHGFACGDAAGILRAAARLGNGEITGVYSHLADAYSPKDRRSRVQAERFLDLCERLRRGGLEPGMRHLCNSAGFARYPELRLDAVRLGSAILGRGPGAESLTRIGFLRAEVEDLYHLPRGSCPGYGHDLRLARATDTAVVGIGYAHGFCLRRGQSGVLGLVRGLGRTIFGLEPPPEMRLNGQTRPVLGVPGCASSVLDVTGLDCQRGDAVTAAVNPLLAGEEVHRVFV